MDEESLDNPSACLTGPLEEDDDGGNSGGGSNLDINSIAEAHREKSRAQSDLKRQFEEFSRNLSFGRSGSRRERNKGGGGAGTGGSGGALNKNRLEIPSIAISDVR